MTRPLPNQPNPEGVLPARDHTPEEHLASETRLSPKESSLNTNQGEDPSDEVTEGANALPTANRGREIILATAIVAIAIVVTTLLRSSLSATNLATFYLLGVVAVATRCGIRVSVAASFASVAAFDFFCVPPYLTFRVTEYEYLITFAGMLVVAWVISTQTARIRAQAKNAEAREVRTEALYRLARRLAGQTRAFEAARTAAEVAEQVFSARVAIFLPDQGKISFRRRTADQLPISSAEETIAQWVFEHSQKAGKGTGTFSDAAALYVPLRGAHKIAGVMCVLQNPDSDRRSRVLSSEQMHFLELFANQAAVAIERILSQQAAETARIAMQTEQMRSSLLSAVSHDLRTPLASITGAASTLRSQGERLPPETRQELLESIGEEAERLGRLVSNLLDMTKLDSGVELRRDFYPLEEIVGSALQRLERQMEKQMEQHPMTTNLPDSLPLVYVDDLLAGQLIVNLLENALKYTPPGTAIEIEARAEGDAVFLEIRDRGPGFTPGDEQRVFEKFYRGASIDTRADVMVNTRGAGLGLAICRAIVDAHRGTIEALNREGGGAIVRVRLPLAGPR